MGTEAARRRTETQLTSGCPYEARTTSHTPTASERIDAFRPDVLEDEYAKFAAARKDRTHADAVHASRATQRMLNKLFFPLVELLHGSVGAWTDDDLKAKAKNQEQKIPPTIERAWNGCAHITRGQNLDYGPAVRRNALEGNSKSYNIPALDARATEFCYRWPSRSWLEDFGYSQGMLGFYITPVGAYGPELAKEMVLAASLLVDIARAELKDASRKTYCANRTLITQETARARFATQNQFDPTLSPLATLAEGVLSLNQVLSTLLLDPVPGAKDGADALHALIFDGMAPRGLVTDFTSRVPMGVTGPLSLQGRSYPKPVVADEEGRLSLPPETQKKLREYFEMNHKPSTGVCPMTTTHQSEDRDDARKVSGLQLLAEAYWRVFEMVHARNKA